MSAMKNLSKSAGVAVTNRYPVSVLIAFVLLVTMSASVIAGNYHEEFIADENWRGHHSVDFDPLTGLAVSSHDSCTGEIKVYSHVNVTYPSNTATAEATASLYRDFTYNHHTWLNTFAVTYFLYGSSAMTGTSNSEFHVSIKLYEVNSGVATLLFEKIDYKIRNTICGNPGETRTVSFRRLLTDGKQYRFRVTAWATCSVDETQDGSATIDFHTPNFRVEVDGFSVSHTHCSYTANGGVQGGAWADAEYNVRQDQCDYADGLTFNSKNYDDESGAINGYRAYIANFDDGESEITDETTVHYNVHMDSCDPIPRGYINYFHLEHWLENQRPDMDCNNNCRIADMDYHCGSAALMAGGSHAIPDHGWKIYDPVDIGEGRYVHAFVMTNDDPLDTLRISSLTFYATMDRYDEAATVQFPDSIHYYSILGPGQELPIEIVTDGDMIGGYIYFAFSISDAPMGDSVICNAWGGHHVVADPRYFVTGDSVYTVNDAESDTTVVFKIWNDVSEMPTRDFGYSIASEGHFGPAVAKCDTVYDVPNGSFAEVYAAIDASGAAVVTQDTIKIVSWPLDSAGVYSSYSTIAVDSDSLTGSLDEHGGVPDAFKLWQNHPNPFNPATQIVYDLPEDCRVKLEIYNVLGQRIVTLVDEWQRAGRKGVEWRGTNDEQAAVASGIYFYRLEAGSFVETRKMVLLR